MVFEFVTREPPVSFFVKSIIDSLLINIKGEEKITNLYKKIGEFFPENTFFFCEELFILIGKNLISNRMNNSINFPFTQEKLVCISPHTQSLLDFKKKLNNSKFMKEFFCEGNIKQTPKKLMQIYQTGFKKKVKSHKQKKIETFTNLRFKTGNKKIFLKVFQVNLESFGNLIKGCDFWKKILASVNSSLTDLGVRNLKNLYISDFFFSVNSFSDSEKLKPQFNLKTRRSDFNRD